MMWVQEAGAMPPEGVFLRPSRVEVDLDAISANYAQIRAALGKVKLCAVVKADGYGAGAVMVARHLESLGIERLAVVTLDEAVELRQAGVTVPILNMGAIFPEQAPLAVRNHIEQTAFQPELLGALDAAARTAGTPARIHIKVDTGMSRYGLPAAAAATLIARLPEWSALECIGVMTHFPMSDGLDKSFAQLQIGRFAALRLEVEAAGRRNLLWHMCNSGGVLDLPEAHMDMVRVGLMLYGYYPSREVRRPFDLRPALQVRTRIAAVRTIGRGDSVGYGRRYLAERPERIAVLPVGYADGYDRKLRNIGEVLVAGRRAPIVGGLCMDACFINVTAIPEAMEGSEVTLMGNDGGEEISPHDIAARIESVSYEVMARWGRRLPRLYRRGGEIVSIRNDLLQGGDLN